MKITKKEAIFLNKLIHSEFAEWSDDGSGWVGDWVCSPDYDMKITRGLMSSLEKKGIVVIGDYQKGFKGQDMTWVSVELEYLNFEDFKLKNLKEVA